MSIIIDKEIKDAVPEAYLPFSAYVIQTRALPDARDFLKTGGRYILWAQYLMKNTYDKNRKKAADTVGAIMHWNPHGDSSIYGSLVRFAKPFAMRYRLEDSKGNVGTMTAGNNHTAMRYLEIRSSEIASEFTKLIKKNTIDNWKINYTNEDKYPAVFPTLFPNFVNGNTGIGVGCISSIPCFNLTEAINSLKKLVINPNASYDEIYINPDFPTGATIINANQVKESLKKGRGAAIKMRAVIEYNEKTNSLIVKELPYQVFTDRIMEEIEKAINEERITGIKSFYDGTDKTCGKWGTGIEIELNKAANPQRVCKQLYKETSLQTSFTICQLVLENGIKPKVYGLKDIMLAYLNHATSCLKKSYIYDCNKIKEAILVNEGLLIAIANMDEIINEIKTADTETIIYENFKAKYNLSESQTKAILNLKLQRLSKLGKLKIEKELEKQKAELATLKDLIENEESFKKAFINELNRIANSYGDCRRTKILNLDFSNDSEDAEPIEKKELLIHYTNLGNIYTQESTTLMKTRRGGKGSKIKLAPDEVITKSITDDNYSSLMVFTNKGQMYNISTDDLPLNSKINIKQLFDLSPNEHPTAITSLNHREKVKYFTFITKQGMVKKTAAEEYNLKRGKSIKAINLKDGDEVVDVLFINNEKVGLLTFSGNYVIIDTETINAIGRVSTGVKGIKLNEDDYVIDAKAIAPTDKYLITLSERGLIKKTSLSEFSLCSRATKGKKISGVKENDRIVKYLTFSELCDIIIIVNKKQIKISTKDLKELSRSAIGVKAIDLKDGSIATNLVRG